MEALHKILRESKHQEMVLGTTLNQSSVSTSALISRPPVLPLMKLNEDQACAFSQDISMIPGAIHGTTSHLSSRHVEVSQWQAQILECVHRVNQEICLMDQMIDSAESVLSDRQLYSRLVSDCVSLSNSITMETLKQHHVTEELYRENQLSSEVMGMLQKQIVALKEKQGFLKNLRSQLISDHQDKSEAIKLTSKCIVYNTITPPASRIPLTQYKPNYVSYDQWVVNCTSLKTTTDQLIKEATTFRTNLRFTLNNFKQAQDAQRQKVDGALRKAIHNLKAAEESMIWDSQKIKNEIGDLERMIQKIATQMRNCDTRFHQASHRLDILNRRPRQELCIDEPFVSLTLERNDLTNLSYGLRPVLNRTQQELELTLRRLRIVEDKLAKNANVLDVMNRCQNRHQTFVPSRQTTAVISNNKPRAAIAMGSSFLG